MNVVWLRNDIRLSNNPALFYACEDLSKPVLVLFTLNREQMSEHDIGSNKQSLVYKQTELFAQQLMRLNIPSINLNVNFKQAPVAISKLLTALGCEQLFFNIEYPIDERVRDRKTVELLTPDIKCHRYNADTLVAPWTLTNLSGQGYKVLFCFSESRQTATAR